MSMIQVSVFLMVVVFFVLFCICLFIKLFSFFINKFENHLNQEK